MRFFQYSVVAIASLAALGLAAPKAVTAKYHRLAMARVSRTLAADHALVNSFRIPGMTVVGTLRGAVPHAFHHARQVGRIKAVRIPAVVLNGGDSDTMMSLWGILSIRRVLAGYQVVLTTWQGTKRLLLRWNVHPTAAQLNEGPLLSFAVGGNPAGVWSTGSGVPLMVHGQGSTEFLWWNLATGALMPISNPAGAVTTTNVNYPDTVSTAADWILTWSQTGQGEAWSFIKPSQPAQPLPSGFQAEAGTPTAILGEEDGSASTPNAAAVYNLLTHKLERPRIQPTTLFHQITTLADESAVLQELWLPGWGPSYVAVPIHEDLQYSSQSIPVVQANGRHRIDLRIIDGTVLVGNRFLVDANWKTRHFSIGYPNSRGIWQWHAAGAATPNSLMVYAGGVSWSSKGATWVWQAPLQ
ncbi:MAG: hypothetical protein C7B45_10465 [Sulfobacillus acidophilus]|uniref:Uncharacterized protein n=1 Tax=Sulfobacillus acidophilus TaxID=53633 RepID=A0A2T2WH16_9FIRM|nr:MAG: hypothetical protein C7B45_10465 [Sulfobacillus acidophilus]